MATRLVAPGKKSIRLAAVHPNEAVRVEYQRRIDRLVSEMAASLEYWLTSAYRSREPITVEMASDESSTAYLNVIFDRLAKRWNKRFADMGPELAKWFGTSVAQRSDATLKAILKRGGWTVQFRMTAPMNEVLQATIKANVELIKTIPAQYLALVQGSVMRSIQTGRDVGGLAKELRTHFGVTKRRAAFIARSQNNIASAAITRVRQESIGVTRAVWRHSHAGKQARPSHLANDGNEYEIAKGWFDPDEKAWTWPGVLPNCRCLSLSIIEPIRTEQMKRLKSAAKPGQLVDNEWVEY